MNIKYRIGVVLTIAIAILVIVAITHRTISDRINEKWPLSTYDQRYASITRANHILNSPKFMADVAIKISKEDFIKHSKKALVEYQKEIEKVSIEGLSNMKVSDSNINLIDQGIRVAISLSFQLNELDIPLNAIVSGDVAIEPRHDHILFRPALTYVELKPSQPVKERWLSWKIGEELAVEMVTALLNNFLENINAEVFKEGYSIPFDIQVAKEFSPKDIKPKQGMQVSGSNIPLHYTLPTIVTFIDNDALIVIGSTTEASNIGHVEPLGVIDVENFRTHFQTYSKDIHTALVESFGEDISLSGSKTSVLVRKETVSNLINSAFNQIELSLSLKDFLVVPRPGAPAGSNKFAQDIAVHEKQNLPSCKGLYREFKGSPCDNPCSYSHINCDVACNLPSCDYGCKWSRPDRCVREAACKALRETKRAACDAKKATCIVDRETRRTNCERKNTECRLKRETDRIAHQTENELRVAKCKSQRLALILVDGLLKLGEIEGEYWVNNSRMTIIITNISVENDLSAIAIKSNLDSSLDARLRIWVNPEGLGHIACIFNFRKTLETHATYSNSRLVLKGAISHRYDQEGNLVLVWITEPVKISANLSPSPYSQLIQDPGFLLNCTFLNMAIPAVAGTQLFKEGSFSDELSTLFGHAKYELESQEIPLTIRPVEIGRGKQKVRLNPKWLKKAIRFELSE